MFCALARQPLRMGVLLAGPASRLILLCLQVPGRTPTLGLSSNVASCGTTGTCPNLAVPQFPLFLFCETGVIDSGGRGGNKRMQTGSIAGLDVESEVKERRLLLLFIPRVARD